MIFIHPKGMTVTQWFKAIRMRNFALSSLRKSQTQKTSERRRARKPLFGRARTFFKKIVSTGARS